MRIANPPNQHVENHAWKPRLRREGPVRTSRPNRFIFPVMMRLHTRIHTQRGVDAHFQRLFSSNIGTCVEPVFQSPSLMPMFTLQPVHSPCWMRYAVGSVAHYIPRLPLSQTLSRRLATLSFHPVSISYPPYFNHRTIARHHRHFSTLSTHFPTSVHLLTPRCQPAVISGDFGVHTDSAGRPFIDRDPKLFRHVLNYLRSQCTNLAVPTSLPSCIRATPRRSIG